MKKALVYLTTLAMCLSLSPAALAADGTDFQIDKSKTADTEVLDRDNPVTEVTLSLPSGEYQNKIDIVFVMDDSSSIGNSGINFRANLVDLFDSVIENNKGVELRIGIVKFSGYAISMLGDELVVYNGTDEDKDALKKAIEGVPEPEWHGSNPHAGLIMANTLLEADETVGNDHKYVVFLTDGKGYIWNNEENEPVTYYTQFVKKGAVQENGKPVLNQVANSYNREQGASYVKFAEELVNSDYIIDDDEIAHGEIADDSSAYYKVLFNLDTEELKDTNGTYDCPAYYTEYPDYVEAIGKRTVDISEDSSCESHLTTNGKDLLGSGGIYAPYVTYYEYTPGNETFWKDINYLKLNPYIVDINDDGNYYYTETVNDDFWLLHPDGFQKALYQTGHYWNDVINKNYNTAVIGIYNVGSGSGTHLAGSFTHWLKEFSDVGIQINQKSKESPVTENDIEKVATLFEDVDNSIRYVVNSGKVTDEITEPFDLVMDGYDENIPFKLVVGEDEFTATAGEEANTWTFGEKDSETDLFPYVVSWDSEANTFTWTINVPVENANPVQLSYKLKWNGKGEAGVKTPTNDSTLLEYTTTDGTDGEEEFESPEVLYPLQITYKANYTGGPADVTDRGDGDNYYKKGDNATLKGADLFTRSGYTFSGWSLTADGAATYQPGGIYEKLPGDVTLYAVWTQNQSGGGNSDGGRTSSVTIEPVEVPLAEIPEELNGADHFAYVEGYPDGTVKPEGNISRAEITTMLYRLLNPEWRDNCFTDQNVFSDVDKPMWYNKAVSSMAKGTYVEGYPDGTFKGNNAITRAEFVTIMVRFLNEDLTYANPFIDIDKHWAKSYILKAVGAGWINGYPDGTFRPDQPITRVEAMKIINSVLHRGVDATSELGDYINFPDNSDLNKWYYYEVIEAVNNHEYVGERPNENWTRNAVDYFYDINKYERPEA
ncbi:MAG: S-layer homology domain-containing protein [Clostridia bacterium]|nr:S-layer homology domain-containing protein [Clostridia bacterium]